MYGSDEDDYEYLVVHEVLKRLRETMLEKWITREYFIQLLDSDGIGKVSFETFRDLITRFKLDEEHIDYEEVFCILDSKGTGKISVDDFMEALTSTDDDLELEELFGEEDKQLDPFPSPYMVGLVAHNNMKPSMMKFVKDHLSFFRRVKLVTTGSTGRALASLGLEVAHKVSSGPLGGDQEIGALITQDKVCAVFFFTDPLSSHPHQADIEALNRICNVHDIFIASNPSTANCLVYAMEHSKYGYARMTGKCPSANRESEVVQKYKKGQDQIIQSVSANSADTSKEENKAPKNGQNSRFVRTVSNRSVRQYDLGQETSNNKQASTSTKNKELLPIKERDTSSSKALRADFVSTAPTSSVTFQDHKQEDAKKSTPKTVSSKNQKTFQPSFLLYDVGKELGEEEKKDEDEPLRDLRDHIDHSVRSLSISVNAASFCGIDNGRHFVEPPRASAHSKKPKFFRSGSWKNFLSSRNKSQT